MIDKSFYGKSSEFAWFLGIVEDRQDPILLGRVRVRCYGWHTDDLALMPTKSLPWALVGSPTTSASVSGLGASPSGLVEGSLVFGFFLDGLDAQQPMILSAVAGIPAELAKNFRGFFDPRKSTTGFPVNSILGRAPTYPAVADEPDSNRLARAENTNISALALRTYSDSVFGADGVIAYQPTSPYQAKFPFNHVTQTESGHTVEFDDTVGHERISETHRSGTFREIGPDGSLTHRTVGSNYEVIQGNSTEHVVGKHVVVVDGAHTISINNDLTVQVVRGNYNLIVTSGNATLTIAGNLTINASGNITQTAIGTMSLVAQQLNLTSLSGTTQSTSSFNVQGTVTGQTDVKTGTISLKSHVHADAQGGTTGPPQ